MGHAQSSVLETQRMAAVEKRLLLRNGYLGYRHEEARQAFEPLQQPEDPHDPKDPQDGGARDCALSRVGSARCY